MSFDTQLSSLLKSQLKSPCDKEKLIQCMDLTLLDEAASDEALNEIIAQSQINPITCVCVFAKHLQRFKSSSKPLATVVNFPGGNESVETCLATIEEAYLQGVKEIDYVFPYSSYLANNKQQALDHCEKISIACKEKQLTLKIILETCAFPTLETLYQASLDLLKLEPDFLKTSTGKAHDGATLASVFAIISAIKEAKSQCGIKISGGVKSKAQADAYVEMAQLLLEKEIDSSWFRIGASSLLKELGN